MKTIVARVGEMLSTVGRQAVPIGGVFTQDWQPVSAIAIYWLESVLLALVAVALCALVKRRTSDAALADARRAGDGNAVRAMEAERAAVHGAGIEPSSVFAFHIGSLFVFGIFFTLVMVVLIGNGRIDQRFEWHEVRDGAVAMLAIVSVGFLIDLWRFPSMSVAAVQSRVNTCLARWALFWLLGFVGVGLMVLTGRAGIFLALFGGLKLTWEVWATLARTFGWRSLKEREASGK